MDEVNATISAGSDQNHQDTDEYIAQMVAKAEGKDQTVTTSNEEGDGTAPATTTEDAEKTSETEKLLAGKYKSVEDLEKAYKELESKLGAPKEKTTPKEVETPPTDTEGEEKAPSETEEEKAPNGLNIDFDKYTGELTKDGALSEASYNELTAMGLPKEVVDGYITGLKLQAEQRNSDLYSVTNGEDNWSAMVNWASSNISKEEAKAFNAAISQDIDTAKLAAAGLYAKYAAAKGSEATMLHGNPGSATASKDVYTSWAEAKVDMGNPAYQSDPAFRTKVQEKIGRSKI